MNTADTPEHTAPRLDVSRLLLVVTGSVAAASTPVWVEWLRSCYPRLELTIVVTRSAQRFVTHQALCHRGGEEVRTDVWPDDDGRAHHVELTEWAQAIAVYPATLHFMGRLALGLADSPALLAAQCTPVPVAVAPALPPGGLDSAAVAAHWSTLADRDNVVLIPPVQGKSRTTGRFDAWVPPPLPHVIEPLERRRAELADARAKRPRTPAAFLADGAVH